MKQIQQTESSLLKELEKLSKKFENDLIHRTFIYDELVEYFHQYMPRLLKYSPLNLYTNALSNFIKYHIGAEVPGCIEEEFKVYEETHEFKSDIQEVRDFYKNLIEENVKLSPEEFNELLKLALVDENSQEFIKFLLGQLIEGNNSVKGSVYNALISKYFENLLSDNNLYCEKVNRPNPSITKQFNSKQVGTLYEIFYGVWATIQQSAEYNEPSVINMIKIDDYFRDAYGEDYYDENHGLYASTADCHLNATLLLADFLQEVSPTTFHEHKDWLAKRAEHYTDMLYDRQRLFKGSKYDIDEIFDQTLAYTGEKKEEILGHTDNEKVFQKEIKI